MPAAEIQPIGMVLSAAQRCESGTPGIGLVLGLPNTIYGHQAEGNAKMKNAATRSSES